LLAALDARPGKVGGVLAAQATNQDLYLFERLAFEQLQVGKAYLAGRDPGWHDDILVSADKNPNTAGAIAIGGGRLKSLMDLAADLRSGAVSALLVLGADGVLVGETAATAMPLDKLSALVVL